ncbi:hypothetical protein CJZ71_07365 [Bacillus subtilis]|uniref:hypothetical protein n=1 Tax=Bacillus subtilis TaxID=1423 RepID=UPI000852C7D9|nr:hypothetical protein [Bacillus subtilis]AOS69313.1 hypothetical protein A4A60_17415 [Bacillus subtilis]ARW33035.1 hypothetical protein S101441_03515 [Bacillus subtilis subsp. subtilis]ASV02010.1 hypothetical protein CJZ71_07365 [Bacillus subtilis]AYK65208.1 hypothetical protein D9C11_06595 [Bacillus subtilis subsp. subtilis]AYK72032.1 hypothetical protein D9C09_21125 [Bacillus subtilis subsp. subtilis]
MKNYYDSHDVKTLLNLKSLRTAQLRIKTMNDDLKAMGYWVERGKVPIKFFHEKYPYVESPGDSKYMLSAI